MSLAEEKELDDFLLDNLQEEMQEEVTEETK